MSLRLKTLASTVSEFRPTVNASQRSATIGKGEGRSRREAAPRPYAGYIGNLIDIVGPGHWHRDIEAEHIDRLLRLYEDKPASYNQCLNAVRGYLDYCVRYKYMGATQAERLLSGKKPLTVTRGNTKRFLSAADLELILTKLSAQHPRERFGVILALYTAIRQSEIKGITLGQVHPDDREFQVYRPKVNDHFTVPWSATLRHETFDIWLPCYAAEAGYESWQEMQAEHPDWPLFPCLTGSKPVRVNMAAGHPRPLRSSISRLAHTALENAGIAKQGREGMHLFRRSAAMICYREWEQEAMELAAAKMPTIDPLNMVREMLGHTKLTTTLEYLDLEHGKQEFRAAMRDRNPIDRARAKAAGAVASDSNVRSLDAHRKKKTAAN